MELMTTLRLRLNMPSELGAALKRRGGFVRRSRRIRGRSAAVEDEEELMDEAERGEGWGVGLGVTGGGHEEELMDEAVRSEANRKGG